MHGILGLFRLVVEMLPKLRPEAWRYGTDVVIVAVILLFMMRASPAESCLLVSVLHTALRRRA